MKEYALIVIGGGMAGLSSALTWLNHFGTSLGPVLLIEKEPHLGGCVTSFVRDGFRFDTVQLIPEIQPLLDFFKLDVDLQQYDQTYARLYLADPSKQSSEIYPIASSEKDFKNHLKELFPDEDKKLDRFFSYGNDLLSEVPWLMTEPNAREIASILWNCPKIIRRSGQTYKKYLKSFQFKNQRLLEILDIFSSFSGLSGDRCAALLTACATMTTLQGSYRPSKGFIQFPQAFRRAILARGGEIQCNSQVDRILVDNGKVTGVRCGNQIYQSRRVISTADSFKLHEELLDDTHLTRAKPYWRKLRKSQPSPSSFTIHLGLKEGLDLKAMGFDCGYNVLTTGTEAHEEAFRCWDKGELLQRDDQFHMAVISPSAAVGGKPTLVIHVMPAPMADWRELRDRDYQGYTQKKEETARWYIKKVQDYMIPNLQEHIELMDVATPATYQRYLGSTQGCNNDMLALPNNFGKNRLAARTPIKGLILPKFSHGIWPSLQAGLQAVDILSHRAILNGKASLNQ